MSDQDPTTPDATPTPPGEPAAARPAETEPTGPLAGLMATTTAEAEEEAAELRGDHDPEAEALLAQMGVEDEGIEAGQVLGLWLVTIFAFLSLAAVVIYLFIIPQRTQAGRVAEGAVANYEQERLRTEAEARLLQYARDGETYGLPISRAQALLAATYADRGEIELPEGRAEWNTSFGRYTPAPAVVELPGGLDATTYSLPADGVEEIGVDIDTDETVDVVGEDEDFDGAFE